MTEAEEPSSLCGQERGGTLRSHCTVCRDPTLNPKGECLESQYSKVSVVLRVHSASLKMVRSFLNPKWHHLISLSTLVKKKAAC